MGGLSGSVPPLPPCGWPLLFGVLCFSAAICCVSAAPAARMRLDTPAAYFDVDTVPLSESAPYGTAWIHSANVGSAWACTAPAPFPSTWLGCTASASARILLPASSGPPRSGLGSPPLGAGGGEAEGFDCTPRGDSFAW